MQVQQFAASLHVGDEIASLIDDSVGSEDLLKSKYRALADSLISENVLPTEIAKTARRIIEDAYLQRHKEVSKYTFVNRWFSQCMSAWGFTDSLMARHLSDAQPHQENGLTFEHEVNAYAECAKERNEWIQFALKYSKLLELMIRELEKDSDTIFDKNTGKERKVKRNWSAMFDKPEFHTEFMETMQNLLANVCPDVMREGDQRQMILPQMRFDILALIAFFNAKHFGQRYFVHVKNMQDFDSADETITTKKLIQFRRDDFSINDWFALVRDKAWQWYFMEMKCPDCRNWSLRQHCKEDGTWGWICRNKDAHGPSGKEFPASLFYDRMRGIASNYKGMADKHLTRKGIVVPPA